MKDNALKQWKETSSELIKLLNSVSQEKFNKIPFEGSWTAGQLGDHLLKSYGAVEVLNGSTEKTDRPADEKVAEVKSLFLDFSIKMNSPEEILPSEKPLNKESIINGLQEKIEAFNLVIENKDLTETCTDYAIPEYGPFTRLEWIHFSIVHTQRHVHQLRKIISNL
tara:strand:- start:11172 stop:11669 length:498 start_codon:yes stop_codon:yes gene_type:complete